MFLGRFHAGIIRLAAQAAETPAIGDGMRTLSYASFLSKLRSRSAWLRSVGASPGRRFGVVVPAGIDPYLTAHALWWAGATFVPISGDEPPARARGIVENTKLHALIADAADRPFAEAIAGNAPVFVVPAKLEAGGSEGPVAWPEAEPLYILHTSGSSGRPKGVPIPVSCVENFVDWAGSAFGFTASDRFFGHTRLTFDLSIFDLFVPFASGGSLEVAARPADRIYPGARLAAGITAVLMVPGVTAPMTDAGELGRAQYPRLRHLLFCGEALTAGTVRAWQAAAPSAIVHNLYGPTEATVACSWFSAERPFERDVVPIGKAVTNMTLTVLGNDGAAGAPEGELLISGPQVSPLGYLEAEAGGFCERSGLGRSFRSGDRVRVLPGGDLLWVGREDAQVKVRGFRVELGDIEASLSGAAGVIELACVHDSVRSRLCLALRLRKGTDAEAAIKALEALAEERLPEYMRPAEYRVLPELPRSPNGKIDRRKTAELLGVGPA